MKALPDNDDKSWEVGKEKGKNETHQLRQVSCPRDHKWEQFGSNAECRVCHIGFPLGAGGTVQDGHIYIIGEKVI